MTSGFSRLKGLAAFVALASICAGAPTRAQTGVPRPWQLGFQDAVTPIAQQIHDFHDFLLVLITVITIFVLGLMVYAALRFNEKSNPKPSRTSHNTTLEVLWTVVPIVILVVIAVPSFRLLYAQYDFPKADLTIKAIGSQWYWTYEYPDHDSLTFDSVIVEDKDLKPGQPRLLTTDTDVVVPVDKNVHMLVTATDVLHSWTIPAFGVKADAVPGRIIKTWFRAEKPGVYYGQCSELCGSKHAFMPITVRVVSEQEFATWLEKAKKEYASVPSGDGEDATQPPSQVARLVR